MDRFVQLLSKQKPTFTIECQNQKCGISSEVDTIDFFANDEYSFICPLCNCKTIVQNIGDQLEEIKDQFRSMGIRW